MTGFLLVGIYCLSLRLRPPLYVPARELPISLLQCTQDVHITNLKKFQSEKGIKKAPFSFFPLFFAPIYLVEAAFNSH